MVTRATIQLSCLTSIMAHDITYTMPCRASPRGCFWTNPGPHQHAQFFDAQSQCTAILRMAGQETNSTSFFLIFLDQIYFRTSRTPDRMLLTLSRVLSQMMACNRPRHGDQQERISSCVCARVRVTVRMSRARTSAHARLRET